MKENILPAIRLTLVCMVFFCGVYTAVIWAVAQAAPGHGEGVTIGVNGKRYYENVGQAFTQDKYFWSRPSAVNYYAAASGGSNKGPSNPDYLQTVQRRIDTFIVHNPGIAKADIPSDLVTASGSGLDPDISVQAARVQVNRIARIRGISESELNKLVNSHVEAPMLDLFGPEKVNVLKLNIALDQMANQ